MIGIFVLDEKPTVNQSLVLAHSKINDGISGYFYFRESDCADVCSVDKGSEFFGVLDDTSGFGACLFIIDLELEQSNLLLQHNLHVKENALIDKDLRVKENALIDKDLHVKGNSEIDGKTEMHDTLTVDNNITGRANADITGNLNVKGNIISKATITGKSPNTSIFLNPANVAMILGAAMSGAPAALQAVQVDMNNSI